MPLWLIILLLFLGSFLFFGRVYRIALAWFVRARVKPSWEIWAELVTVAASLPFAIVYGLFSVEVALLAARLLLTAQVPLYLLPALVKFMDGNRHWLAAMLMLLFLARMVPQTIASSKIYAYNVEAQFRDEVPGR